MREKHTASNAALNQPATEGKRASSNGSDKGKMGGSTRDVRYQADTGNTFSNASSAAVSMAPQEARS